MSGQTDFTGKVRAYCDSRGRLLLAVFTAAALLHALRLSHVNDDAFISFNYARALVRGEGLTWFGVKVEGYTNFLWVLWSALGIRLGFDPAPWSWLGSLASYAAVLLITYNAARRLTNDRACALLSVILLGANFTMAAYATSGLETMLQTALLAAAFHRALIINQSADARAFDAGLLSALLTAALLARLDSAVIGGVIGAWALISLWKKGAAVSVYLALILPVTVIAGGWEAWRIDYYGQLLPNTFYAKVSAQTSFNWNGLNYIYWFLRRYQLWPFLIAAVPAVLMEDARQKLAAPAIAVLFWFAYIIAVGGDFMEFRFIVPAMPLFIIIIAHTIYFFLGERIFKNAAAASLASVIALSAASYRHSLAEKRFTGDYSLDTISGLATFYGVYPNGEWGAVGTPLKTALHEAGAVIAVQPAGAIPYYSELPSVDMWGLNDLDIPLTGQPAPPDFKRPGHRRHATLQILLQKKVNLVIGHPKLYPHNLLKGDLANPRGKELVLEFLNRVIPYHAEPFGRITLIEVPVYSGRSILMLYLIPTPALDAAIARAGWNRLSLTHGPPDPAPDLENNSPIELSR